MLLGNYVKRLKSTTTQRNKMPNNFRWSPLKMYLGAVIVFGIKRIATVVGLQRINTNNKKITNKITKY